MSEATVQIAKRIKPGETGRAEMPFSEVNMHMRIAGKPMRFLLLLSPRGYVSVQLFEPDQSCGMCDGIGRLEVVTDGSAYEARCIYCEATGWRRFSSPITTGEAGIYQDDQGFYYYPEFDHPRMMPGQAPYTPEELVRVQTLVSDAAKGDPGETDEEGVR